MRAALLLLRLRVFAPGPGSCIFIILYRVFVFVSLGADVGADVGADGLGV